MASIKANCCCSFLYKCMLNHIAHGYMIIYYIWLYDHIMHMAIWSYITYGYITIYYIRLHDHILHTAVWPYIAYGYMIIHCIWLYDSCLSWLYNHIFRFLTYSSINKGVCILRRHITDVLHNASLRIILTVPEVVGTENWVTSNLPFLLDPSSIAKMQS